MVVTLAKISLLWLSAHMQARRPRILAVATTKEVLLGIASFSTSPAQDFASQHIPGTDERAYLNSQSTRHLLPRMNLHCRMPTQKSACQIRKPGPNTAMHEHDDNRRSGSRPHLGSKILVLTQATLESGSSRPLAALGLSGGTCLCRLHFWDILSGPRNY